MSVPSAPRADDFADERADALADEAARAAGLEVRVIRPSDHPALSEAEAAVLDERERARAAAFVRDADRHRYQVAHLALRRELGARLDVAPQRLAFVREPCPCCGEPHGRPAVAGGGPHFSLSHADDLVLIAFARVPVGADVERRVSPTTVEQTVGALHPDERAEITALPAAARPLAFTRCWTRKEAYLKGTGSGLGEDPSVTYVGSGPTPATVPGWRLLDLTVPDDYAAAVALRTGDG